uniref:Uncharacterized protein n=1 Tax=Arundo donax TaxID=35708 RepID=A0A0A9AVW7_ARUDO
MNAWLELMYRHPFCTSMMHQHKKKAFSCPSNLLQFCFLLYVY